MGSVTLRDLSQNIDVSQISKEARTNWERSEKGRLSLERKLLNALPIGLVIMVMVFYSLSAPHTAHILDMVTPGWGMFAPIGFEIGILIVAALIEAGWHARLLRGVEWLLLSMGVVINVAASFLVVVASSDVIGADITAYTFQELVVLYPAFPASVQLVLVMVVPIGFTIPIITKLAGEAVVKLALGRVELNPTSLDELWEHVEQREIKSALMQAALNLGAGVKTSGKWSSMIVEEIFEIQPENSVEAVGNQWENREMQHSNLYAFQNTTRNDPSKAVIGDNSQFPSQIGSSQSPKLEAAIDWLVKNEHDRALSGRQLEKMRTPNGEKLSYRTWNDAKRQIK